MKPPNIFIRVFRFLKWYYKLTPEQKDQYWSYYWTSKKNSFQEKIKFPHFRLRYLLFILVCLTIAAGSFKSPNFNFLHITVESAVVLIAAVATLLATLFGISIAFIVLTLESSKELFSWHSVRKTFTNAKLRELATLFLSTIFYSIIIAFYVGRFDLGGTTLVIVIVDLYLLLICLGSLIPYIRDILDVAGDRDEILRLSKSIKSHHVNELSRRNRMDEYTMNLENNPLIVLSEVGVRAIRRHDRFAASWVLQSLVSKFKNDFEKVLDTIIISDLRDIISGYVTVINEIGIEAIKSEDTANLVASMRSLYSITLTVIDAGKIYPVYEELHESMVRLITRSITENFPEGTERILRFYPEIIIQHWNKNAPRESELWEYQKKIPEKPNYDLSLYWDSISSRFLYDLNRISSEAIDAKQSKVIEDIVWSYYSLSNAIIATKRLGKKQIRVLSAHLEFNKRSLLEDALNANIQRSTGTLLHGAYSLNVLEAAIDDGIYYIGVLKNMGDMYILYAGKDKNFSFQLNELGTLGRTLTDKRDKAAVKKALLYLVNVFDDIRKKYEASADKNPEDAETYLEIHKQLDSIYRWKLKKENKSIAQLKSNELKDKYKAGLDKFKKINSAKKFLEKGDYWKSIFKDV